MSVALWLSVEKIQMAMPSSIVQTLSICFLSKRIPAAIMYLIAEMAVFEDCFSYYAPNPNTRQNRPVLITKARRRITWPNVMRNRESTVMLTRCWDHAVMSSHGDQTMFWRFEVNPNPMADRMVFNFGFLPPDEPRFEGDHRYTIFDMVVNGRVNACPKRPALQPGGTTLCAVSTKYERGSCEHMEPGRKFTISSHEWKFDLLLRCSSRSECLSVRIGSREIDIHKFELNEELEDARCLALSVRGLHSLELIEDGIKAAAKSLSQIGARRRSRVQGKGIPQQPSKKRQRRR